MVEIGLRWLPKLSKDQSLASLAAVAALDLILKFNKCVGPNNRVGRNFSKCDKCVGLFYVIPMILPITMPNEAYEYLQCILMQMQSWPWGN